MTTNPVTATPPATPAQAEAHFAAKLAAETDCDDVHTALLAAGGGDPGFVLLEARGPAAYARAHIPGAISLPYRTMIEEALACFPSGTLFITYCAGPHCNAADKAALRLARLGRRAKTMQGGLAGWIAEGFPTVAGEAPGRLRVVADEIG
jgi:rhodanese-related sulfurtransferase